MTVPLSETLKGEVKILIFDQYGTIVDMQKGLTEVTSYFTMETIKETTALPI